MGGSGLVGFPAFNQILRERRFAGDEMKKVTSMMVYCEFHMREQR